MGRRQRESTPMSTKSARPSHRAAFDSAIRRALKAAVSRGELTTTDMRTALDRLTTGAGASNRKGQRADSTARRDDILQAAVRLFVTKGYHAATLQDIADELGLTRPAFYYYFRSKQEILESLCQKSVTAADDIIDRALRQPSANLAQAVRQTLEAYAAYIASDLTTAIMMRNYEEMSPAEKQRLTTRRRARQDKVLVLVKKGIRSGEFAAPHPKIAVLTAFEAIHSVHSWYDSEGPLSREKVARVIVEQILSGLLSRRD